MSLITPTTTTLFLPHETFRNPKRRRFKPSKRRSISPRNQLGSSPSDFLSLLSYNWISPAAAALASAIAVTVFGNRSKQPRVSDPDPSANPDVDIGEWILFTSPTPFNRFVLLRCPSIWVEEVSNSELVKQERHYVRLATGRMSVKESVESEEVEYQRVCVATEDGGVVSLDWPLNLELSEEHGMDTTVLVVPGTHQGSMDHNVRSLVCDCLRRGLFPVVMNPRGCAGSPLTTPRLFTAADSDDICSAVRFITRARPWSTMLGVGLGYGANMLTKYLAEAGEKTPLAAATCIDNPFDLDEATRTSSYNTTVDKNLTQGLIDILKTNKDLFQGRRKGFDVEKALLAESVRDFEEAISMVSYGFETLEEFYSNSSTRSLVGKLKIPVLFIQNDDGTVPLFSIPRGLIAENPYTNLLLCSCLPSNFTAISWYHQVTIEWLSAVELGLLKGRHPLLEDIDVTINPSKSSALAEGRTPNTTDRFDGILNPAELNSSDVYVDSINETLKKSGSAPYCELESQQVSEGKPDFSDAHLSEKSSTNTIEADSEKEAENNPVESDIGQVLQTSQVVMNMLDATMPGTLKEEDKKKVLAAVGRGETLITALQDAVPEDVRGKLTSSVSQILEAQGKNLNFDGVKQIANLSLLKAKIKESAHENSDVTPESKDQLSDERDSGDDMRDSNVNQDDVDKDAEVETEAQPQEEQVKSSDLPVSASVDTNDDNTGLTKASSDSHNNSDKSSKLDVTAKVSSSSSNDGEVSQRDDKDSNMSERVEKDQDLPDQNETGSLSDTSETPLSTTSEAQQSEKGDGHSPNQTTIDTNSPSFSGPQALDALMGMDDSTQMAVNSVFGVIEGMLPLPEEQKNDSQVNKENENTDDKNHSVTDNPYVDSEIQLEKQINGDDDDCHDANPVEVESVNVYNDERNIENDSATLDGKNNDENDGKKSLIVKKLGAKNADSHTNIRKLLFYVPSNPYREQLYKEYIRKYILSQVQKMKPLIYDTTTSLFIDDNPEEGEWLLQEQPEGVHNVVSYSSINRVGNASKPAKEYGGDNIFLPSYVVLDTEQHKDIAKEWEENMNNHVLPRDFNLERSKLSVKSILLDSLKVEASRRLCATDMKEMEAVLEADMKKVANAIYIALQHDKELFKHPLAYSSEWDIQQSSRLNGNLVIEAIFQAVQNTSYLKRVLPVGVIVGSTLAALRKFFDMEAVQDNRNGSLLDIAQDKSEKKLLQEAIQLPTDEISIEHIPGNTSREKPARKISKEIPVDVLSSVADVDDGQKVESESLNRDTLMVGAVTAAFGASAILSQQDAFMGNDSSENLSSDSMGNHVKTETVKNKEVSDDKEESNIDKEESNIVTSLAEKAMSVAGPIVPTKEGGEVDHGRIVEMLAQLGQRGGILRLVGKLGLLWGGLRGAMSLTDRLFSLLRITERPLWQRLLGFFFMALVLWSPVLVPVLPTLFHNWATHNSSEMTELGCILGLYAAITILIMQWGRRVRGHEYPLKQYGLDFMSSEKVQDFLTGLGVGVILVFSVQSCNVIFGFTKISWPSHLISSSLDVSTKIKACGKLFILASQGILTAAGVAFVEELLFRSWMLEEIATDLGYQPAIFLSALAFALSQRSLHAIPGLLLLSLALAGARLRKKGSLFIPIGIRTGILASTFLLQKGGFLTYLSKYHFWMVGTHPSQPFSGVVGLIFSLSLALVMYPRQQGLMNKVPRISQP